MLEPLLFRSGIIKDRIPELENHFVNGGYVLIGNTSIQKFEGFIEIRIFSKQFNENNKNNNDVLTSELLSANKEFQELVKMLPKIKKIVEIGPTQIGLYHDYGGGSIKLCSINGHGKVDSFLFSNE